MKSKSTMKNIISWMGGHAISDRQCASITEDIMIYKVGNARSRTLYLGIRGAFSLSLDSRYSGKVPKSEVLSVRGIEG